MTTQSILYPGDAPFNTTTIPTGRTEPLTQAEADAANILYPVPPYGPTYFPPGSPNPPPFNPRSQFVLLTGVQSVGITTTAVVSPEDYAVLPLDTIFPFWPVKGILGIVDDVGVRPARVIARDDAGHKITLNYDSSGLDVTGLVLLGVVYTATLP